MANQRLPKKENEAHRSKEPKGPGRGERKGEGEEKEALGVRSTSCPPLDSTTPPRAWSFHFSLLFPLLVVQIGISSLPH